MASYRTENLYWFLTHSAPSFTTRGGVTSGINTDSFIDVDVISDTGKNIVNTAKSAIWNASGQRIYPSANADYDLLLKFTLTQYLADPICSDSFKYFVNTLIAAYGLKNVGNYDMTILEVWVNPNKQIDRIKVQKNANSAIYYYDQSGNCLDVGSTDDDKLCVEIPAVDYIEYSAATLGGWSSYIAGTLSGGALHPELALSGAAVSITTALVDMNNTIFRYKGSYSSTNYLWSASGLNQSTADESLNLVNQILYTSYTS